MKPMKVDTFSKQQLKVLSWWCKESRYKNYDAIICDGAVRSGKTFCMSISFLRGAFTALQIRILHSAERLFALCAEIW